MRLTLWMVSNSFYCCAWVVWWTKFLASRWKYLGISGRSIKEIFRYPAGKDSNCERKIWFNGKLSCDTRTVRLSRSQQENEVNKGFLEFHKKWCDVVLGFRKLSTKVNARILNYAGEYRELCDTMFWLYATWVFLFNVLWFPLKIVQYKMNGSQDKLPTKVM